MKSIFITPRLLYIPSVIFVLLASGFAVPLLFTLGQVLLLIYLLLVCFDFFMLFHSKQGVTASRSCAERFSNGDDNAVTLLLTSNYPQKIHLELYDEVPVQFQMRDFSMKCILNPFQQQALTYKLRPLQRGEYHFGNTNIFVESRLGLIRRRFKMDEQQMVKVYPSFVRLQQYELLAISNRLHMQGIKRIRKLGHNMEFEQIKDYVAGDDMRTINWKASARKHHLMVNTYQDEKSQPVYAVIDTGRAMKMPFDGMTLLDYAINAALVFSHVAIRKDDKAGLVSFAGKFKGFLQAGRLARQMESIMEYLYRIDTGFDESDFESLYINLSKRLNQRSLLLLFTNFESVHGLHRQLSYLRSLNKRNVLVVIFFENPGIETMAKEDPDDLRGVYHQVIAGQYLREKRQIAHIL
ncbi:MAG: DUF58 domain-containing protein, partial [Cyclobacteriaceae bacterium]